jgi:hypothetical protein
MIFFTTFILTLFTTLVGRAVAQVGDHDPISRCRLLIFSFRADQLGVQSCIQQRV